MPPFDTCNKHIDPREPSFMWSSEPSGRTTKQAALNKHNLKKNSKQKVSYNN